MDKNIAIVVAGAQGQEIKDATIKPGTTAADILKGLSLQRYVISKRDGKIFGPRDNVYEAVDDGEKLFASAEAEVGLSDLRFFLSRAREVLTCLAGENASPKVSIQGIRSSHPTETIMPGFSDADSASTAQRTVIYPQTRPQAIMVQRRPGFYWEENDWNRSGQSYIGYFHVNEHRCPGVIVWNKYGLRDCVISNPPGELWQHPHAPCFTYAGDGEYRVHFRNRPKTVDAAILTIERILNEAVRRNC